MSINFKDEEKYERTTLVWQKTGGRIKHQLLFCYFASVSAEGIKFSW